MFEFTDRIRSMRRPVTPTPPYKSSAAVTPPGFKVKGTEKRSAQLLVRLKEEAGEPVSPALRAVADAPVQRRKLTPEQQVEEVQNALSVARTNAAACPSQEMRVGMNSVISVIESALNGEFD